MPHQAWDVYLGREHIETVFFQPDCDRDYVYRSLVNHDGYDPRIRLVKCRMK